MSSANVRFSKNGPILLSIRFKWIIAVIVLCGPHVLCHYNGGNGNAYIAPFK